MSCQEVFQKIEELNQEYISVWEQACAMESPTKHKSGVDAVGAYFAALARERGWQVEVFEQPTSGNVVCITMNLSASLPPISLSGHMDTVHEVGAFGTPAVRSDGERLYGPGVTDCKGGIVSGFLAMDALRLCGFTERPVRLLLQSDEENSSALSNKATIGYICEKAKDSVAFLNLEGHTKGEACLIRKGIVTFTFTVRGKAAHASNCATAGANAIADAAYKIIEMEKLKDADGLTCNCGVVRGGSVPNTVPDFCEFQANVRFATQDQLEFVRAYAQTVADTVHVPGCTCTLSQSRGRVAMELCERNIALLERMNRIFEKNGLPCLTMSRRKGGSDAADVTAYGIPCVDSIGVRGGKIHSLEEYAYLDSLAESAKRIAAVVGCWEESEQKS